MRKLAFIQDEKKSILLKNTVMLYILQFSTYFLSLIVVPYETRVLTPVFFGKLGVATAIMVYFQLFIDFGFLLSATEEVSRHREDNQYLSRVFTAVTISKLLLSALSLILLLLLCRIVPSWRGDTSFFMLYLIGTIFNSLIPDYLYRGIEQMSAITIRTVLIKLFFTVMIFLVVKQPNHYYRVPILNIIGCAGALLGVYYHLYKRLHIRFIGCRASHVIDVLRRASTFFLSRIATTAYTASNTVIIDILSAGMATGFYSSADKIITTAKNGMSPIADSLYPYMTRHRDFSLVKKVLMILMPIIMLGCVIVFIFAKPLCIWFFGPEYAETAPVLRAMLPVVVVILPSYVLGFPTLSAMGLSRHANYSVIFGSLLHIVNLFILYISGHMNMVTLGILVSIAETAILLYRIIVIYRNRDRLKTDEVKKVEDEQ